MLTNIYAAVYACVAICVIIVWMLIFGPTDWDISFVINVVHCIMPYCSGCGGNAIHLAPHVDQMLVGDLDTGKVLRLRHNAIVYATPRFSMKNKKLLEKTKRRWQTPKQHGGLLEKIEAVQ